MALSQKEIKKKEIPENFDRKFRQKRHWKIVIKHVTCELQWQFRKKKLKKKKCMKILAEIFRQKRHRKISDKTMSHELQR